MVEELFALTLGFTVVGYFALDVFETSRKWRWVAVFFGVLLLIAAPTFYDSRPLGEHMLGYFIIGSFTNHIGYFLGGACTAVLLAFYEDGVFNWLWRRIDSKAGSRGPREPRGKAMSTALMGTSTAMFAVKGLDIKTVALVRLALVTFTKIDSRVIAGIESSLKLGDGRRYKAFHKLVSESQSHRQKVKDIVQPYWCEINGNHASARKMFTSLCQLARDTGNTDRKSVDRLVGIGQSLGLSPENMGLAINQLRV